MKLQSIASLLVSFITWQSVKASFDQLAGSEEFIGDQIPGRFILFFKDGAQRRDIPLQIRDLGLSFSVKSNWDSPFLKGQSIQVENHDDKTLQQLKNIKGVDEVWPSTNIKIPETPRQLQNATWDTHSITGVNELHKRGEYGDDIVIAVVDSGVDYDHEVFGGTLGKGAIIDGWDIVDNPNDPGKNLTDCFGHGTFTSSIAVGNSKTLSGVAPRAKVKMYKVFGCKEATPDDIVISGVLKAAEEKPDLISVSIGADGGYPNAPLSRVGAKIAETIPIIFAAGNDGQNGVFTGSAGGSGQGVIPVGSVTAASLVGYPITFKSSNNQTNTFNYVSSLGSPISNNGSYQVDFAPNVCSLNRTTPGPRRVLFANKGQCKGKEAYDSAIASGYETVFIVTEEVDYYGYEKPTEGSKLKDMGMIGPEARDWIKKQQDAGNTVSIDFNRDATPRPTDTTIKSGGKMDDYSSWGPTFMNNFYPYVSAPGGYVIGAAPGGGYSVGSGTSFACPYISGVTALYLKNNRGLPFDVLTNKIIAATNLLPQYILNSTFSQDNSVLSNYSAPLIQQGAGLIDAVQLFDTRTLITSSPLLELNDTDHRITNFEISFKNQDTKQVSYKIKHVPVRTTLTRNPSNWVPSGYFPDTEAQYAQALLSQSEFTLGPNESAKFNVEFVPPALSDKEAPAFQGIIGITGSNGDYVKVPYMGIIASTYNWTPFEDEPLFLHYDNKTQQLSTLDQNPGYVYNPAAYDSPRIYFDFRYGSEIISFDLVEADYQLAQYKVPLNKGDSGYIGPLQSTPDKYNNTQTFPNTFGSLTRKYVHINFKSLADGSLIPDGTYRLISRALKTFGDQHKLQDWQLALSEPFKVGSS